MPADALTPNEITPPQGGSVTLSVLDLDRRKSARSAAGPRAVCYVHLSGGQAFGPIPVRDLSRGGLRLALDRPLDPGMVIAVSLYSRPARSWAQLEARGVYGSGRPGEGFLVGAAFATELSEEQVRQYLA